MIEYVRAIYHAYMHGIPDGPLAFGVYWPLEDVLLGSAVGLLVGALVGRVVVALWLLVARTHMDVPQFNYSRRRLVGRVTLAMGLVGSLLGGILLGAVFWIV